MARRLRGKAWGNALGGWRRQRRNSKGQFSKGGGVKRKATRSRSAPIMRSSPPKMASNRKRQLTSAQAQARKRRNRNIAIGAGVGVAVIGAALVMDNRMQMAKIVASGIGDYKNTYKTPSGVTISTRNNVTPFTVNLNDRGRFSVSHRPMVTTTSYAYREGDFSDTLLGYRTVSVKGNTAKFDNIYVDKAGRGQGLSKEMTNAARKAVAGKKVRVSAFRSDQGDALSKKLFSPEEIPKRYNPKSKRVKNITTNMDRSFRSTTQQFNLERLAEAMKEASR